MKKIIVMAIAAALSSASLAQDLPKPSPTAHVEQVVGLTEISVTYSRPGVKGREIWGSLVPYEELWRAGANKATLFSTSYDIKVGGQMLPKGDYSLFIIPRAGGNWTLIFNKETELWGAGDYKQEQDQLRVEARTEAIVGNGDSERMEFRFLNVDSKTALFVLDWAGMRMMVDIESDPHEQALANIEKALEEAKPEDKWRVLRNGASYARDHGGMADQGLSWIQESVKLKPTWVGYWVYADLLAQNGDYKGAIAQAETAIKTGEAEAKESGREFTYTATIQADIDEWKGMTGKKK